ncbi:MAG: hypothetical protein ACK4GL_04935 [Flavobacteriales bacterium]
MFYRLAFLIIVLHAFTKNFFGQDTLLLIDRPFKIVDIVEVNDSMVVYAKPGKRRLRYIERDKAYSVRSSKGKPEQVVYLVDSLEGNVESAWDMKYYMQGQLDALKGYRGKSNRIALSGIVFGASGAPLGLLYGPVAPASYIVLRGVLPVRAKPKHNFNMDKVQDDMYVAGYNAMARKMTMKKLYWTSLAGYGLGIVAFTVFFINN